MQLNCSAQARQTEVYVHCLAELRVAVLKNLCNPTLDFCIQRCKHYIQYPVHGIMDQ